MMMMMADNITGVPFGQVPNQVQRPLISLPRQQTAGLGGFDVSKTPIANPNGGFTMPVTQLKNAEIPSDFRGASGGNTMLAAQIQTTVAPRQIMTGGNTPAFKFANTEGQIHTDAKGGVGAYNLALAKNSGAPSGEIVTKTSNTATT